MKDQIIKFWIVLVIVSVSPLLSNAQSDKYKEGKKAYLEGRKKEALSLLNDAIYHEKFLMKGKEIPMAYAYMASIRNEHLASKLKSANIEAIAQSSGLLSSTIDDISNAIKFQDGASKSTINRAKGNLIKNAMVVGHMICDSLLNLDLNIHTKETQKLASMLNYELKNLSEIDNSNWELHDMIGLSYYILDEKDLAMLEFKRARDIYNKEEASVASELHLYNCIYSSKYHYKTTQNYTEAHNSAVDGQKLVDKIMTSADGDSLHEIKKMSSIEGTFSSIQSRIENMNILSSSKE